MRTCLRFLSLILCMVSMNTWSLTPSSDFIADDVFGDVSNFRCEKNDIDLSIMDSDLSYQDLSSDKIKELDSLFEAKKDYGKMFGFNDWTPDKHKLVEENSKRIFLLQGHYKDAEKKTVHFMEVYWADKNKGGQFLFTSNSKVLSIEDFKEYLK